MEFDIVEALYSQVHYASSLLVSEKPISGVISSFIFSRGSFLPL